MPRSVRKLGIRVSQTKFTLSVAAVIIDKDNRVLLLDHVLRPNSGWGLPGGFIDRGEQPDAAIKREISEETGIGLENLKLYKIRCLDRHVEVLFTANPIGEVEVNSPEIIGFDWFEIELLPKGMSKPQKDLIIEVVSSTIDYISTDR